MAVENKTPEELKEENKENYWLLEYPPMSWLIKFLEWINKFFEALFGFGNKKDEEKVGGGKSRDGEEAEKGKNTEQEQQVSRSTKLESNDKTKNNGPEPDPTQPITAVQTKKASEQDLGSQSR